MISLPPSFEERMKIQLKDEYEAFFHALQSEAPVSIRLNPAKSSITNDNFLSMEVSRPIEWCKDAYYLSHRPKFTLDPCFHGGSYYVQEASSMFLYHTIKQIMPPGSIRVLDLCAAPGGKSTMLASMITPDSLLVSNEVIRSRAAILKENVIKWGHDNVVVTQSDPSDFSGMQSAFDIILVDAPCSGEGMFRKDDKAIEEWSENNLKLCSERQKRILSDIWDALKPEGFLIYSTCTYNRGENEDILAWLSEQADAEHIPIQYSYDAITPGESGYGLRFYPHKVAGEGFFIGVVCKKDGKEPVCKKNKQPHSKPLALPDEIRAMITPCTKPATYQKENLIGIVPAVHEMFIRELERQVNVIYKGCEAAELIKQKIKPLPSLALYSHLDQEKCRTYTVNLHTALTFLKKEDIPVTAPAGEWVLISYRHIGLGWGKSIGNRLNNYYPKEWRIRMDIKKE